MARVLHWRFGFALVLLLHLFIHPAVHDQRLPQLLAASDSQHNLTREEADSQLDICSLCRAAHSLHAPAALPSIEQPLTPSGPQLAFTTGSLHSRAQAQLTTRAPPAFA